MNIMLANFTKMVEDSGGLAQVTCRFANEMIHRGHTVTLVYSDVKEGNFFFPIDSEVKCFDLRHFRGNSINYPAYLKLKREWLRIFNKEKARTVNDDFVEKKLLKNVDILLDEIKPDIIVSFQPAASKILLCDLYTKIPVITMSHGDPEDYFHTYPKKQLPSLAQSAVCQVLVPSFAETLKSHDSNINTIVIGNAVPQYMTQADLSGQKNIKKILFLARLSRNHKRPHLLIEAFAKIVNKFPDWQVELWGDENGKLYYEELKKLISKNNLQHQVFLKGRTSQVEQVISQGDIFVFPSAYEGFGLSLAEAMSMGIPAIGYKNCSAVNELIKNGINGFLCDDGVDDLAHKMEKLMSDQTLRVQMGQAARESMRQYAPKVIWDTWERVMKDCIKERR